MATAAASAYSPDQTQFAQAIREGMNYLIAQRVGNIIGDAQHRDQTDAVMRVAMRYCMFVPEMLRPGFLLMCGCPDTAIVHIMNLIEQGEAELAKHGTLDAVEIMKAGAANNKPSNATLQ